MYKQLLFGHFGFKLTFHISYFVGVFPDSFTVKPEIHCHYVLVWFLGFLLVLFCFLSLWFIERNLYHEDYPF